MKTMSLPIYTTQDILARTRVKLWPKLSPAKSLWDYLTIPLTPEQQNKIRFAPIPEVVTLQNPKTGPYEGWRTAGGNWVTIFPLTSDQNVVTVIEYKHGVDEVVIGLPAGNYKAGEDVAAAIQRELLEETGFSAKTIIPLADSVKGIGVSCRKSTARYFSFLAQDLVQTTNSTAEADADEDIEAALIPLQEWLTMIERGLVRESSAIVTTFLALRALKRL